ncbi:MAG: hypothetical protein ACOH18_03905 [Candidatus Saccharimonadaceae bacterium]
MIENQSDSERLFAPADYRAQLEGVLSQQVTPENINSYANGVFLELIPIIDTLVAQYDRQPTIASDTLSARARYDKALNYFGLGDIILRLDDMADVAKTIDQLGYVITTAKEIQSVIIHPNTHANDNRESQQPAVANRLKSVLFLLAHDFDVKLRNPYQVKLTRGNVKRGVARQPSYYMVEAPTIDRIIFVCDEDDNNTYTIDTAEMARYDITPRDIAGLNQLDLHGLFEDLPELGKEIVHSEQFLSDVKQSLVNTPGDDIQPSLYENIPEGYLSTKGIKEQYAVEYSYITLWNVITQLRDRLGDIHQVTLNSKAVDIYLPEQIEIILAHLSESPKLNQLPYGYLSHKGAANKFGSSWVTIDAAATDIGEEMGEVRSFMVRGKLTEAYSPRQIDFMAEYFSQKDILVERAPGNYMSASVISMKYHLGYEAVRTAAIELTEQLGEVRRYRFGSKIAEGYSQEQASVIIEYLRQKKVQQERTPKNFMSANGIAKEYGVSYNAVRTAIDQIKDELGEAAHDKLGPKVVEGYSPEQIGLILERIIKQIKLKGSVVLSLVEKKNDTI